MEFTFKQTKLPVPRLTFLGNGFLTTSKDPRRNFCLVPIHGDHSRFNYLDPIALGFDGFGFDGFGFGRHGFGGRGLRGRHGVHAGIQSFGHFSDPPATPGVGNPAPARRSKGKMSDGGLGRIGDHRFATAPADFFLEAEGI